MHAPCRRGSPPKRAVPVALGPTQDQTSAAISIRRVARLSRNVGQPDHILANPAISHKAERRPGSGEIWFAVPKHDGVQVDSILIDQAYQVLGGATGSPLGLVAAVANVVAAGQLLAMLLVQMAVKKDS